MSLLLAVTLAAAIQPTCSWDNPGRNPYTGSPAAAIDRYTDIPENVRATLKRRLADDLPDDAVSITRDHISGNNQYGDAIRDMHFGAASVCGTVTRNQWSARHAEPAAVYCVGEHCILVPKICGNVSRVTRLAPAMAQAPRKPAARAGAKDKPKEFADIRLDDADLPDAADATEPRDAADSTSALLDPLARLDQQADFDGRSRRLANTMAGQDLGNLRWEGIDPADAEGQARELARRMAALGERAGGDDGMAAPVPEADTWAMLVSGLGLVGWLARRRARAAQAAANATA